ncbi:vWA domain-containing protein [Paraliomyxa miuraensis]|uniref:vWA domain-containing protein n=1 Tax=Paraliomyxa miuraensis TaxID=376150 RepID=UPI002252C542|nr:VWA domain-containing protein [Paraliomyxa miuraensis]MCX4240010.1 von Willebrand factor type A domain-containing protein [Paraliomyxa miuraensis]
MRHHPRTIVVLAAPLLAALCFGCAKKAPRSHAPDDYGDAAGAAYEYDDGHAAPYDEYEEYADGALAGSDSAPESIPYDMQDDAPEMTSASRSAPEAEPAEVSYEAEEAMTAKHSRDRGRALRQERRSNRRDRGKALATAPSPGVATAPTQKATAATPPPKVAVTPLPAPIHDTEAYGHIQENEFIAVADDPRSTFSIDVDTASYSNMRRFLREGRLPPADAVRIEELVNYFDYAYPQPRGEDPFSVTTEVAPCPWNTDHRLVHVGLQGKDVAAKEVPPRNLVFLLDVSGSMSDSDKLPLLKHGMKMLADQLRPQDRVSIVVYAGASGVVLEPTADRDAIKQALSRLEAGGSTNGGAGIELAYQLAAQSFVKGGINRVILATDGDFNVGVTSEGDLVRLIEHKRESGVFLSVLGFGRGNLNDSTMEQLADKGNGNYAYIDSGAEAHKVLVEQAGATLMTIAKDVKIQVEFNPAEVAAYRLVGYENRKLAHRDFNDDTKDAGEIGAGHTVTALYEVVPVGQGTAPEVDPLKYQDPGTALRPAASSGELMTVKLRYKQPTGHTSKLSSVPVMDRDGVVADSSESFRFAAAVAEFGLLLRHSKWRGNASWAQAYALAGSALGIDSHGRRAELLGLIEQAAALSGQDVEAVAETTIAR